MSKRCGNCNYQNEPEAQFCDQCGAQLDSQIQCHNCQTQNATDAQFCYRCGQSLTTNASARTAVDHQRSAPEPVSRSTPDAGSVSGVSGSGWQPAPYAQPMAANTQPGQRPTTERRFHPDHETRRGGFTWKRILLSLPILVPLLWFFWGGFYWNWMSFEEFAVRILVSLLSIVYLFWIWRRKGSTTQRIQQDNHTMQGEVRGFNERQEDATADGRNDTIWSFRLERYQDGRQLQAIPVEMRGRRFKGFIREGDIVRLEDKWKDKGVHRTKRLYNVTNNTMVEAKGTFLRVLGINLLFIVIVIVVFIVLASF